MENTTESTPVSAADAADNVATNVAADVVAIVVAKRTALRRERLAAREALTPAQHAEYSAQIAAHLRQLLATLSPAPLAFCWPYRAEFDFRALALELHEQGWPLCLPVVSEPAQAMVFRHWQPDAAMATDRYGIAYPASGALITPAIVVLPFNAVDQAGYRLGYGAGYFDRTLASLVPRPHVIGVGFSLACVESIAPQAHDVPMDCWVTELGVALPISR